MYMLKLYDKYSLRAREIKAKGLWPVQVVADQRPAVPPADFIGLKRAHKGQHQTLVDEEVHTEL